MSVSKVSRYRLHGCDREFFFATTSIPTTGLSQSLVKWVLAALILGDKAAGEGIPPYTMHGASSL
jgi:hypothetical protein